MSGEAGFVMVKYDLLHFTCSREERERENVPVISRLVNGSITDIFDW